MNLNLVSFSRPTARKGAAAHDECNISEFVCHNGELDCASPPDLAIIQETGGCRPRRKKISYSPWTIIQQLSLVLCVATSFPERTFSLPMSKSASATRSSRCHYLRWRSRVRLVYYPRSRGQICVDEETVQYKFVLPRCSARTDGGGTPFKQLVQHIKLLNMTLRNLNGWAWDHHCSLLLPGKGPPQL